VQAVHRDAYNARMDLLDAPLSTAEFLVVDTETNGKAGDLCEMTEVGAVLVGGGELHDRFESLVGVRTPLSRGIQRFTGISQAMVDGAPAADIVLPDLLEQLGGRILVGHNVSFDRRVLRQAFERADLEWPTRRAVHGRARAPLRAAGRAAQARRAGRARWASRSRSRTGRSPTPRPARGCSARCSRACAPTRRRWARRSPSSSPRGGRSRGPRGPGRRSSTARVQAPAEHAGRLRLPQRRGPAAVRRQVVRLRTRARSHFAPSSRAATGPRRRRSSTTAPRSPSSERCCSRTG
jgi:DNA polymerase-3 subunit epsilon